MRINAQPLFILHTRPFQDTSLLLDALSIDYGRIHLLARNARGFRSHFKGMLQPFMPFLACWSGKTELMYLSKIEPNGLPYHLQGKALICGLYINELLVRLLHREDPHPQIFQAYKKALQGLQQTQSPENALRLFEKTLLSEIGYGVELTKDSEGKAINPQQSYYWHPEKGFSSASIQREEAHTFNGKSLLALHQNNLESIEDLRAAKQLLRLLLLPLLGEKPIKTRELF